jgi:hypothetical protein
MKKRPKKAPQATESSDAENAPALQETVVPEESATVTLNPVLDLTLEASRDPVTSKLMRRLSEIEIRVAATKAQRASAAETRVTQRTRPRLLHQTAVRDLGPRSLSRHS